MKKTVAHRLLLQAALLASLTGSALALGPPDPVPAPGGEPAETPASTLEPIPSALAVSAEGEDSWSWLVAPYLWATDIDGELSVRNVQVDMDVDFGDIWDNLESAGLLFVEARKERLSILGDLIYLGLEVEGKSQGGADADVTVDTTILEVAGLYRVSPESPFEVGLGARFADIESELAVGALEVDSSRNSLDAFAAGRASWSFGKRWNAALYGDVGAGDSDLTWQASALLGLQFTAWSLVVGYRALDYDFEEGSTDVDLRFQGPVFGAEFRF